MAVRTRGTWAWIFLLLFILVAVAEVVVLIAVGRAIGGWKTFGLLIVWSLIGAVIVKREFGRAWRGLREALTTGRMPAKELSDAAIVLVGGTLLMSPGFVTDAMGLLLVLPFTRPVSRALLQAVVAKRIVTASPYAGPFGAGPFGAPGGADPHRRRPGGDDVIEGEIVDD